MNKVYRNVEGSTDVLSFPNHQDIIPGQLQIESLGFDNSLGDIFLCPSVIKQQCVEDETDFQNSLPVYVTHGICHLLGYTHNTKEDWKLMFSKEKEILSAFTQRTGINCIPLTSYSNKYCLGDNM
ncbi:ribonuclease isoform X3 [Paramuricea clavata]|nr:ribonuclease isoform X3 [Paramuricea clavata]